MFVGLVRIASDIEVKEFGEYKVAEFSIAYDTGFGEKKKPCFIQSKAWGKTGELISQHLSKGKQIYVVGEIEQDTWDDKDSGAKRSKLTLNVDKFNFVDKEVPF